ncbi:sortase family protein [Streptococcus intermedius JTH08]|nr:sortase family protein [Streptococcus intermedius JTH08]
MLYKENSFNMITFIKKHFITFILVIILLSGLSLLLYPTLSNIWNSYHQSEAIASYKHHVADMKQSKEEEMLSAAHAYNKTLATGVTPLLNLTKSEIETYNHILDVTGTGIMAYVEIPKLKTTMPIYHGTDEAVLEIAIGHIPGTSFPIGGKGTHAVISGHRGLPSAKLFSNLNQLKNGDTFMIHVLGRTLIYEVDQSLTVKPEDLSALKIDPVQDYCTLVTCTPYGVNTHRLLVRGHRIFKEKENSEAINKSTRQHPVLHLILITGGTILFIIFALVYFRHRRRQLKMKVY